jgi:hypothetical protein
MNGIALVAASSGQFVAGLIIGLFLGLLMGPILRSWLAWREWVDASKAADLTERFLARWEEEEARSDQHPVDAQLPPAGRPIRSAQEPEATPAQPSTATPTGKGSPA